MSTHVYSSSVCVCVCGLVAYTVINKGSLIYMYPLHVWVLIVISCCSMMVSVLCLLLCIVEPNVVLG